MGKEKRVREISGKWGYAILEDNALYIPAIMTDNLSGVLAELYNETKQRRMIFTAVINPEKLKRHLRNIKKEWIQKVGEGDCSYCIEIEYEIS